MKKFFVFLLAGIFLQISPALSETTVDSLGNGLSYKAISSNLSKIEDLTKAKKPDIDAMVDEIPYLNSLLSDLESNRKTIEENIYLVEKRIDALGEENENLPEAKIISQKRKEFNRELSEEKTRLSEIDILVSKIDELNLRIFDIRNEKLWGNLLSSSGSFVNPSILFKANQELLEVGLDIVKSPFLWYSTLKSSQKEIIRKNIIEVSIFIILIILVACRKFNLNQVLTFLKNYKIFVLNI